MQNPLDATLPYFIIIHVVFAQYLMVNVWIIYASSCWSIFPTRVSDGIKVHYEIKARLVPDEYVMPDCC
jgi:hypothetical protein